MQLKAAQASDDNPDNETPIAEGNNSLETGNRCPLAHVLPFSPPPPRSYFFHRSYSNKHPYTVLHRDTTAAAPLRMGLSRNGASQSLLRSKV